MVDVYLNWLNCFYFLTWLEDPLTILIGCVIFLSSFLDVIRIAMSAVSFLAQLDCGILCLQNAFPWLNGFKASSPRFSYFASSFRCVWKLMLPNVKWLRQIILLKISKKQFLRQLIIPSFQQTFFLGGQ